MTRLWLTAGVAIAFDLDLDLGSRVTGELLGRFGLVFVSGLAAGLVAQFGPVAIVAAARLAAQIGLSAVTAGTIPIVGTGAIVFAVALSLDGFDQISRIREDLNGLCPQLACRIAIGRDADPGTCPQVHRGSTTLDDLGRHADIDAAEANGIAGAFLDDALDDRSVGHTQ